METRSEDGDTSMSSGSPTSPPVPRRRAATHAAPTARSPPTSARRAGTRCTRHAPAWAARCASLRLAPAYQSVGRYACDACRVGGHEFVLHCQFDLHLPCVVLPRKACRAPKPRPHAEAHAPSPKHATAAPKRDEATRLAQHEQVLQRRQPTGRWRRPPAPSSGDLMGSTAGPPSPPLMGSTGGGRPVVDRAGFPPSLSLQNESMCGREREEDEWSGKRRR